jgi:type IV secretion system protein VirB11
MNKGNLQNKTENAGAKAGEVEMSALELTVRALRPLLDDPETVELCINRPREAYIRSVRGWKREDLPFADFDWCRRLAKLAAHSMRQRMDEMVPLLSGVLPSGEQLQVVMPPATTRDCVAIAICRVASKLWSLGELAERGVLRNTRSAAKEMQATELEQNLSRLLAGSCHEEFIRLAVRSGQSILVSGPPGAGKTTWMNALLGEIPAEERLVIIDQAQGMALETHPNHVRLLYGRDEIEPARVRPKQLLAAALRLRPERLALMELSGAEAFDFLKLNASHPGTLSSVCAVSVGHAFEQVALMIKQSQDGSHLSRQEIKSSLRDLIDVVIHCGVEHQEHVITEIWYRRDAKPQWRRAI